LNPDPSVKIFIPGTPLAQFVELFWYCQDQHILADSREKVLPNGCIEIIMNLGAEPIKVYADDDDTQSKIDGDVLISGLHTTPFVIGSSCRGAALGICFKPGGAYPILGFPADHLMDKHISLLDVWPIFAQDLHERLLETSDILTRFRLVEQSLIRCIMSDHILHPAVAFALKAFQSQNCSTSVLGLTDQIGLSSKRFIDLFRTQVGLTPKQYLRVQRFQQVLYHIHHRETFAWSDLALAYGYHDQSHFIRDFRALAGVTPTVYRDTHTADLNHLPL